MGWLHDKLDALNDNPLAIIAQVAGAIFGIPSYVTAGVVTAVQGGDIGDIAKSAALSYIATEALEVTGIGKQIGEFTKTLGADFTDTMMKDFNFKPDTMVAISKAATASMNSSIIGGINAAISGKNVMDGISSGFTSGLISSSTGSYFDSLNKDLGWGFSNKTLGLIKGATGSALTSLVTGKGDPAEAVGNYLFSAAANFAKSEFSTQAKKIQKKPKNLKTLTLTLSPSTTPKLFLVKVLVMKLTKQQQIANKKLPMSLLRSRLNTNLWSQTEMRQLNHLTRKKNYTRKTSRTILTTIQGMVAMT